MPIRALPQTAVRAIGSSQTLTDPASVVKELIDNAIDARATSVFIEISANTLDVIQVRDNGHGIAPGDRPLVARRYCTSKIRDEKDLAKIGGSSLGFRGEALSSAAEMSGGIAITTRIEGEDIATVLKISPEGEVTSEDRASHPFGTTIRITDFMHKNPVRKQVALKGSAKSIDKTKQTLQQYAFARPNTRLSLRVLKAKSDRDNWTYAPRAGADVDEPALKVVGKPCASQCSWYETESEGFEIRAFVPRSDCDLSKTSGAGQYISVDGRPMSTTRGVFRQIVKIYRHSLKRSGLNLDGLKDLFLYMGINCPEGSYDPNVEPAKDDVLFQDSDVLLAAVRKLFEEAHPITERNQVSITVPSCRDQLTESRSAVDLSTPSSEAHAEKSRTKPANPFMTNMYDMDEDDLALLEDVMGNTESRSVEEDEALHYAKTPSSNPWVVAKMNARTGKTNLGLPEQMQLFTPAIENEDTARLSSSPIRVNAMQSARRAMPALATPRASSPAPRIIDDRDSLMSNVPTDPDLYIDPRSLLEDRDISVERQQRLPHSSVADFSSPNVSFQATRPHIPQVDNNQGMTLDQIPEAPTRRRRPPRRVQQQGYFNKPFRPPVAAEQDAQTGAATFTHINRPQRDAASSFDFSQPRILSPPPNNRDIRSFIGVKRPAPASLTTGSDELPHQDNEDIDPRSDMAAPRGFVPASELDLLDPHIELESPLHTRPPRRRKTGGRPLVRIINERTTSTTITTAADEDEDNADNDPSYSPHRSTRRRRTTDDSTSGGSGTKAHRTKSAPLPLERTPPGLQIQNTVLELDITSSLIRSTLR